MAKNRPRISLAQSVKPRGGDIEQLFTAADDVEQAAGSARRRDSARP
jgi:hypothetical protein